jgi:hypothetical protein
MVYEVHMDRDYDLTLAKRYRFQVKRQIDATPGRSGAVTATSNVVEIDVREGR